MSAWAKKKRKEALALLVDGGVADGNWSESRVRPLKRESMPAGIVHARSNSMTSLGNAGEPKFSTVITLVMEVFFLADDETTLEDVLDDGIQSVLDTLLTASAWLADIEEVPGVDIQTRVAAEGDGHYGHARIAMQLQATDFYQPVVGPDLEEIMGRIDTPGSARKFGIDIDGDGEGDFEFSICPPQN